MVFKEGEKGCVSDLREKFADLHFLVKYNSEEDLNRQVDVDLIATSSDKWELLEYQCNHEDGALMCVFSGNKFFENFIGGMQIW